MSASPASWQIHLRLSATTKSVRPFRGGKPWRAVVFFGPPARLYRATIGGRACGPGPHPRRRRWRKHGGHGVAPPEQLPGGKFSMTRLGVRCMSFVMQTLRRVQDRYVSRPCATSPSTFSLGAGQEVRKCGESPQFRKLIDGGFA